MPPCGDIWNQKKTVMPVVALLKTEVIRLLILIHTANNYYNLYCWCYFLKANNITINKFGIVLTKVWNVSIYLPERN